MKNVHECTNSQLVLECANSSTESTTLSSTVFSNKQDLSQNRLKSLHNSMSRDFHDFNKAEIDLEKTNYKYFP